MEHDTNREIDQVKRALENTIKIISEVKELDNHESYLDQYANLVEDILKTEENLNLHMSSFQMASAVQTIQEFDQAYASEVRSTQRRGVKDTAQYAEMIQTAKDFFTIASGEELATVNTTTVDEDLAIEENIPTVDPLTKGPLTNPVKNKICGHIYEKSSMTKAIEQGNIRCPQMGCMNKQIIALGHLQDDHALKMKLAAMRAKTQAKQLGMEEDSD